MLLFVCLVEIALTGKLNQPYSLAGKSRWTFATAFIIFVILLEIFAPDTINDIFYNPSNGLDKHLKHNQFSDAVSINNNYGFVRVPKGLVFIIGSANTILPVFTSLVLSHQVRVESDSKKKFLI